MMEHVIVGHCNDDSCDLDHGFEVPANEVAAAREAVARGVAYLDSIDWVAVFGGPFAADFDWRDAVDVHDLDMSDGTCCVLGWIGRGLNNEGELYFGSMAEVMGIVDTADAMGFTYPWRMSRTMNWGQHYELLGVLWRDELTRERAA